MKSFIKKLTQKRCRLLAFAISLCTMLMMVLPVLAEEEAANLSVTEDPTESILLMTLGFEDDAGNYEVYQSGTCFLINDEYVLTNKHVISVAEETLAQMRADYSAPDLQENDSHIKLKVYVNRDMKVAATMHESVNSDVMDFAAVKLAEKIYDRKPVALGDSDAVQSKDPVFAMGFPKDSIVTKAFNTKDDVSTVSGTISKLTVTGSIDIIEHSAPLNNGNSGGPLLNDNNAVIGVNSYVDETKNYSIQINTIKKGLDTFGIPYAAGSGGITPEPKPDPGLDSVTEPDNTAILNELKSALEDAKKIDTKNFTEESIKSLDDSIGAAEAVVANGSAEAIQIQDATDDLNEAINNMEEKSGPNMMLLVIIAAGVVLVIIIIIVVVILSGKNNKKKPIHPLTDNNREAPKWDSSNGQPTVPQNVVPEGVGETTLLDAGAGETTLLGNSGSAYLIRKKNGEKIALNVPIFKLGKERQKVNYCISDNTSISRIHCEIIKRGTDYYAVDQGATNFTFVNGVQLGARKETLLSDQSVLKLSDEEFEFHLS